MEFLFELLIEGLADAAGRPKVPLLVRLLIMMVLVGGLAAAVILYGFSALEATGLAGAIISWTIAAGLVFLWLYGCYRIIKTRKNNSNKAINLTP
jgi:Na+-driven multidrug efflux pump